jgi:putative membrane protein
MLDRLAMFHSGAISPLLAAAEGEPLTQTEAATNVFANIGPQLLLAVMFTLVGMVLFGFCIWLIVKLAPFSVQKEIEEDQNTSLGIIMGSLILGIALILAAAIHG